MRKYLFVIIVTLFLIFIISCDQVDQATEVDSDPAEELVSTTWIKTFGSSTGHEEGKQVIQTSDGLYVAVGITTGILVEDDSLPDNYKNNIYVLKANREGVKIWQRALGGSGVDHGNAVIETSDGGYLVVGEVMARGHYDIYVAKLRGNGSKEWEKTYELAGTDELGLGVAETADGGFIICGMQGYDKYWLSVSDALLYKIDSSGNLVWSNIFERKRNWLISLSSIVSTSDGGYIVVGTGYSNVDSTMSVALLKLDAAGNIEWRSNYNYDDPNVWLLGQNARQTMDGDYVVAGRIVLNASPGSEDFYGLLVKADSLGKKIWWKFLITLFTGAQEKQGLYVAVTDDGSYVIVTKHKRMLFLAKLDSSGLVMWSKYLKLKYEAWVNWIEQTADGGFVLTGRTGNEMNAMFIMKTDRNGNVDGLVENPSQDEPGITIE